MWNNKRKALTFSFDDGVKQDVRLIKILNKYGLKGTFNINSALLGTRNVLDYLGKKVRHDKIKKTQAKKVYAGHEISAHTLTHPFLTGLNESEIVFQVEEDRKALELLFDKKVVGFAYPGGGVNHDERVADVLRASTSVRYARTIIPTHDLSPKREDLYRYNPTCHLLDKQIFALVDEFLSYEGDEEKLLYIWGHSYELDAGEVNPNAMDWEVFEDLCKKLSGREEIFYGTNEQILF